MKSRVTMCSMWGAMNVASTKDNMKLIGSGKPMEVWNGASISERKTTLPKNVHVYHIYAVCDISRNFLD